MYKKIIQALKRISLTKQLFLILGSITLTVIIFVVPYVEFKMHMIVENQMFTTIKDQQLTVTAVIEGDYKKYQYKSPLAENSMGFKVSTLLYDAQDNLYYTLIKKKPDDDIGRLFHDVFSQSLLSVMTNDQSSGCFSKQTEDGREVYFVITKSEELPNHYWISYIYDDIYTDLLSTIRIELVNVLYCVIIIIAFILTIWICSMIRPLRQIQNYIRAIKQGKSFDLRIYRGDEIGEVGDALKDMEAELNRQNKLQSDLIHNISHDLKTPIAIIRSYSECMKEDIYPYGDKNSSLDVIIENADRLEKKVKDFLYLNRLDYLEEKDICQDEIDITEIIRHLVSELSPLNENIEFVLDLSPTIFIGENEHWYSALMNILDNALRYAKTTIKITAKNQQVSIYNDGNHIDEKLKSEIFEPYTKGAKGNFGLGMSIVHKIVTMYHCEITVENLDDGVVFKIKELENKL